MTDWITALVHPLGYPGIVLMMFLENVFPPLPSEVIMPLAGFTASRGDLSLPGAILAGTLGSVLGALPLYWVGFALGKPRLVRLTQRYGCLLTLRGADVERVVGPLGPFVLAVVLLGTVACVIVWRGVQPARGARSAPRAGCTPGASWRVRHGRCGTARAGRHDPCTGRGRSAWRCRYGPGGHLRAAGSRGAPRFSRAHD